MLKISRTTDYGLLAVVYLARHMGEVISAREVAEFYSLPLPMVAKVLKVLHEGRVIVSRRGVGGGYVFDGDPETVTLGKMLEVMEGPWDFVACESLDSLGHGVCSIRMDCPSRGFMFGINRAIKDAFEQITLSDLLRGTSPSPAIEAKLAALREPRSEEIQ